METATYRISKSAWLKEHEHKHISKICQRVEDMTNLDQRSAEDLQVVNYGIGGHYEPHFDFARVGYLFYIIPICNNYFFYRKMRKMLLKL